MLRRAIVLLLFIPQLVYSQSNDLPFQVLVAKDASIYGKAVEPLTYVDDVTSIEVKPEGFLALVHKGGTTYEHKEKIFTFYLKPQKLKDGNKRPNLTYLYQDSIANDPTKTITVLHPIFDDEGVAKWEANTPLELFWHLPDEPVLSYKVKAMDHKGKKIQDFGTRNHYITLKPFHYGLTENEFRFEVSSTFAGETITSMEYKVVLEEGPTYPMKASDWVVKASNLELSPVSALEAWKEVLGMENGKYYFPLFEKFINRNKNVLIESGEDVEQLLSQNK